MDEAGSSQDDIPQNAEFDANFIKAWKIENEQPVHSIEHYMVRWSIENLSLLMGKEHRAVSSPVFILDMSQTEWILSWSPNIFRNGQKCSLFSIQRYHEDRGLTSVGITFRFGASNSDNTTVWFDERKIDEFEKHDIVEHLVSGIEQLEFLTKSTSAESDVFVVNCELYICHEISESRVQLPIADYDLVNLSFDFTKLIHSKESSDFCIKIPHWDIVTHKAILAARSSYFEAALTENRERPFIELSDVSYNNITSLLLFMYSANFNLVAKNGPPDIGFYECALRFRVSELVKLLTPKELHIRTKLRPVELEFTWHVENFIQRSTSGNKSIISPPFGASAIDSPLWMLTINPICSPGMLLGFDIFAEVDRESDVLLSVMKISLLDRKGVLQNTKTTAQPYAAGMRFGFPNFLTQFSVSNKLHGFLQNDTIKVHCHITFVISSSVFDRHDVFRTNSTAITMFKDLSNNLRTLFESCMLYDITLNSNCAFIKAHRSVLFARSRTFASKFLYGVKEDILKVEEIDSYALPYVIEHAYTGVLTEIQTKDMVPLLSSAYSFSFRSLSLVCAELAGPRINLENFFELIKLASKLENTSLLHNCSIFARRNVKEIEESADFKRLKKEAEETSDVIFARILALIHMT